MRALFFRPLVLLCCCLNVLDLHADFFREGTPTLPVKAGECSECAQFPRLADLVRELSPAVVNISVEANEESEESEQSGHPFLKRDPGNPYRSVGSGFIINEQGYIVTNNHVIDKSSKIVVRLLDDKTRYTAELIANDLKTDVALLKINPNRKLKSVFFGNSDEIEVGEWVVAMGNQFQLGQTVTAGIVSAKSRRPPGSAGPYDAFIQTDASINPGSSGGPLFNSKGQVIGINTAIFSPGKLQYGGGTGFNIGIGFAIPINLVKHVVAELKDHGKVTRGVLGVIIQAIDEDVAEALGLESPQGALVADVLPDSPASKAGFQRKDIIVKYNGSEIKEHEDLPLLVANTRVGTQAEIEVIRGGSSQLLKASIDELKDRSPKQPVKVAKANSIGVTVEDLTPELIQSIIGEKPGFDIKGVVVNSVEAGSIADRAGIMRGDIIEELGGKIVKDSSTFDSQISGLTKGKPVLALVRKKEGTRFLTLKVR